jgi:hypothetical protein
VAQPRPWPVRYEITIEPISGEPRTYQVLTWLDEAKAIALAAQQDARLHPEGSARLYSVAVSLLGDAPRDERGQVDFGSDLIDRMEF